MEYLKRTWVEVNLDNLTFNYNQFRSHIPAGTKFLGVVKADAYGHGAIAVGKHLEKLGADFLATAELEEAAQLRNAGVKLPILVLGFTPASFAEYEADNEIRQEVNCLTFARELNRNLEGTGKKLKVHLKLDTGMGRLGFFAYNRPETIDELVEVTKLPNLEIEGCFQHFCVADCLDDESQEFTKVQFERFTAMLAEMEKRGIRPAIRHCCNSGATLIHPEYALDMVRPGSSTYGFLPGPGFDNPYELRPLLSLRTSIAQIKDFEAGVSVSYGRLWTAPAKSRIAVVPVGYADGLSRKLTNNVEFMLHGKKVPQVGRICMDMCMIDVTGVPEAEVGDTVTIIGRDGDLCVSPDEFADRLDTLPHEIACNLSKRLPRLYYENGELVGKQTYIV